MGMISVQDLRDWAEENAFGRTAAFPHGWISSADLKYLAACIECAYPLNYYNSLGYNLKGASDDSMR